MLSLITPHLQLATVLDLPAERLRSLDRVGLLLDLDGTLKDYHAPAVGPPVLNWLRSLRAAGLRLCLLSNGKPRRIEPIARALQVPFVAKAFKPLPFGCRAALRLLDLRPEQAAIVGDQLFADVLAGRLARLLTILVRPTSWEEPLWTRVKRPLERHLLKRMARATRPTPAAAC